MSNTVYLPSSELMEKNPELVDDYNKFVRANKKKQHAKSDNRILLPEKYLKGRGIEVGAFHAPLPLPDDCHADYLDKVGIDQLKEWMPETNDLYCVFPKHIDDGEKLAKVKSKSYDFLIANHMLEHTENVFKTIDNHLRAVKDGGYLFYALPDKRFTFDKERELTTYEHLKDEYYNGSEKNRVAHFKDFGRLVSKVTDEAQLDNYVEDHIRNNRDIHFHVWRYDTFIEQITTWIDETNLNIELVEHVQNGIEFIMIFRVLTPVEVAERLIEKGKLNEAKEMLEDLATEDNKNLDLQNDLAVVAIMMEEYEDAQNIILAVLNVDEENETAINNYQYLNEVLNDK